MPKPSQLVLGRGLSTQALDEALHAGTLGANLAPGSRPWLAAGDCRSLGGWRWAVCGQRVCCPQGLYPPPWVVRCSGRVGAGGGDWTMEAFPLRPLAFSWPSLCLGHRTDLAPCGPQKFGHLAIVWTQTTPLAAWHPSTEHLCSSVRYRAAQGALCECWGKAQLAPHDATRGMLRRRRRGGPRRRPRRGDGDLGF